MRHISCASENSRNAPTRIIKQVLPCLDVPGVLVCPSEASTELVRTLEEERDRMSRRIEHLARYRDAITTYLSRLPRSAEA